MRRQFALELAPHVRVNAVVPGPVFPPPNYPPEGIARIASRTMLKRWGTPDDVADAVLYLVRAEYVAGEVLMVDGGEHLGSH